MLPTRSTIALRLLLLATLLVWPPSTGAAEAEFNSDLPIFPLHTVYSSPAFLDDIRSALVNPAFLGTQPGFSTYFSFIKRKGFDEPIQDDDHVTIVTGYGSFAFGYQNASTSALGSRATRFFISNGMNLGGGFRFGLSARLDRFNDLKEKNGYSFDAGFGYRPNARFSLGVVARNILEPTWVTTTTTFPAYPSYHLGFGYRPKDHRLTFTADVDYFPETRDKDADFQWIGRLGVAWEPLDGLEIQATGDFESHFTLNLRLWLTKHTSVGTYGVLDDRRRWYAMGVDALGTMTFHKTKVDPVGVLTKHTIGGSLSDGPPAPSLLGRSPDTSVESVLALLRKLETQEEITGAVLRIDPLDSGMVSGLGGGIFEIERAITRVRAKGKKVVVYLRSGAGPAEYYAASAADEIIMPITGAFTGLGLSLEILRLRGLLDTVGIGMEGLTAGRYKDALNPLGAGADANQSLALQSLVDRYTEDFVATIARNRGRSSEEVREFMGLGSFHSERAKQLGLVDYVGGEGLARDRLFVLAGKSPRLLSAARNQVDGGLKSLRRSKYYNESWDPGVKVAVIRIEGPILTGNSRADFIFGGRTTGSDTVVRQLQKARLDRSIAAVVLRIDSPGGDANASEEILAEVKNYKFYNKPLVVSFGNLGASGAYWIGSGGNKILASPLTLTGSIGVIAMRPNLSELANDWSIEREVYRSDENADADSMWRGMTEAERANRQHLLNWYYDLFVRRVAVNRNMDPKQVRELAEGRVYTGSQALEHGLVDELGGLWDAVEAARELAGVPAHRRTDLLVYRQDSSLLRELLLGSLSVLFEGDDDDVSYR